MQGRSCGSSDMQFLSEPCPTGKQRIKSTKSNVCHQFFIDSPYELPSTRRLGVGRGLRVLRGLVETRCD